MHVSKALTDLPSYVAHTMQEEKDLFPEITSYYLTYPVLFPNTPSFPMQNFWHVLKMYVE